MKMNWEPAGCNLNAKCGENDDVKKYGIER